MIIGLLGGTGIEGKALALRFAAAGCSVLIGSRAAERAALAAEQCGAVALSILDPDNPYRYLQVRGRVVAIT